MVAKMLVRSDKVDVRPYKSGPREFYLLNCLDLDTVFPLEPTIEYQLTDAEKGQYPLGSLKGKTVEIGWGKAETAFGGALRVTGKIIKVA